MAQWRNGAMAQWRNGAMAQWRNGAMAQWRNGAMAQWRNGAMIYWKCLRRGNEHGRIPRKLNFEATASLFFVRAKTKLSDAGRVVNPPSEFF
jgi:hypothetical protein